MEKNEQNRIYAKIKRVLTLNKISYKERKHWRGIALKDSRIVIYIDSEYYRNIVWIVIKQEWSSYRKNRRMRKLQVKHEKFDSKVLLQKVKEVIESLEESEEHARTEEAYKVADADMVKEIFKGEKIVHHSIGRFDVITGRVKDKDGYYDEEEIFIIRENGKYKIEDIDKKLTLEQVRGIIKIVKGDKK